MALPTLLTSTLASWASYYDAHRMVSVTVRYLHLAGLVVGGGTALAADRRVLRAARANAAERAATLATVHASHRVAVPALAVVVATGALMLASDTATFFGSRLFWLKMGLVTLLLVNGAGLVAAERKAAREPGRRWSWLGLTAGASLVLWLLILFVGVWLTSAA